MHDSDWCKAFLKAGLLMITKINHAHIMCVEMSTCSLYLKPVWNGDNVETKLGNGTRCCHLITVHVWTRIFISGSPSIILMKSALFENIEIYFNIQQNGCHIYIEPYVNAGHSLSKNCSCTLELRLVSSIYVLLALHARSQTVCVFGTTLHKHTAGLSPAHCILLSAFNWQQQFCQRLLLMPESLCEEEDKGVEMQL